MLVVKKFGGSSVANKERIFNVAKRCAEDYRNGNDVVVVLSAMGKTTDGLIAQAKEINPNPPKREMDMLLVTGEQMSVAYMAMAPRDAILPVLLGITATVCAGCIESTAVPSACRIRILGYTDHHLLATAIRTLHILMLRIGLEPTPLVGTHRTVHNVGLPGAEGEELCDLLILFRIGQVVRISHDTGFPFPHEP